MSIYKSEEQALFMTADKHQIQRKLEENDELTKSENQKTSIAKRIA